MVSAGTAGTLAKYIYIYIYIFRNFGSFALDRTCFYHTPTRAAARPMSVGPIPFPYYTNHTPSFALRPFETLKSLKDFEAVSSPSLENLVSPLFKSLACSSTGVSKDTPITANRALP